MMRDQEDSGASDNAMSFWIGKPHQSLAVFRSVRSGISFPFACRLREALDQRIPNPMDVQGSELSGLLVIMVSGFGKGTRKD